MPLLALSRGYPRAVRELIERRPVLSAVVVWVLLQVIVQGATAATQDVHARAWWSWVLLIAVVYSGLAIRLVPRTVNPSKPLFPSIALLRMALAISPVIIASGLAFVGAPSWAVWSTLAASGLLLAEGVLLGRRQGTD